MKYVNQSFTLPVCAVKTMSQLEYDLRVGNLSQEEFDKVQGHGVEAKTECSTSA